MDSQTMLSNVDMGRGCAAWQKLAFHHEPRGGKSVIYRFNALLSWPRAKKMESFENTVEI